MSDVDPRSAMLAQMAECAFRLGTAFGAQAERAETLEETVAAFELFDRCFFAVRMSITLELRLQREARLDGRLSTAGVDAAAQDPDEQDRIERDPAETESYTERERERDREPASMPVLLRTLSNIVVDAAALPGPPPAELPTLRELLARYAPDAPASPSTGRALRSRLAASATTPAFAVSAAAPRPAGGRPVFPPRGRATGPPG